jgi:hypothetical protein
MQKFVNYKGKSFITMGQESQDTTTGAALALVTLGDVTQD